MALGTGGGHGAIWSYLGINTTQMKAGAAQAGGIITGVNAQMAGMEAKAVGLGPALKKAFLGVAAATAILAIAGTAMAASFDKGMKEVWTLIRGTEKEFESLKASVLDLSTTMEHGANDMAQGMYWVVSALPDADDAKRLEVLEVASKLASAGVAELADTTDVVTTAMTAFRLSDPSRVADALMKTVERGKTTLPLLSQNFSKAAASAHVAGLSIEDLGAATAAMTRAGIPTDRTLMSLNRTLIGLAKPSEAAIEFFQGMGYESGIAAVKEKGLAGVMEMVQGALGGQIEKYAELFPNIRELLTWLNLAGVSFEDYKKDVAEFGDTTGTANEAFEIMADTVQYKWSVALNQAKEGLIGFGEKVLPSVSVGINVLAVAFGKIGDVLGFIAPGVLALASAFAVFKIGSWIHLGVVALGNSLMHLGFILSTTLAAPIVALTAAAVGLGYGLYEFSQFGKKVSADLADARADIEEAERTLTEFGIGILPVINEYQNLQDAIAAGEVEDMAAAEARLLELHQQIATQLPEMVTGFDAQGKAILESNAAMKEYIKGLLEFSSIDVPIEGQIGEYALLTERQNQLTNSMTGMKSALEIVKYDLEDLGVPTQDVSRVMRLLQTDFEAGSKSASAYARQALQTGTIGEYAVDVFKRTESNVALLGNEIDKAGGTLQALQTEFNQTASAAAKMAEAIRVAALEAGLAGGDIGDNIIDALQSSVPELHNQGRNALAAYMQGQLERRNVAVEESGGMAQEMANAFVEGVPWNSKGNLAGEEVMEGVENQINILKPSIVAAAENVAEAAGSAYADGMSGKAAEAGAAGGALSEEVIEKLNSAIPAIKQAALDAVAAYISAIAQSEGMDPDEANQLGQDVAGQIGQGAIDEFPEDASIAVRLFSAKVVSDMNAKADEMGEAGKPGGKKIGGAVSSSAVLGFLANFPALRSVIMTKIGSIRPPPIPLTYQSLFNPAFTSFAQAAQYINDQLAQNLEPQEMVVNIDATGGGLGEDFFSPFEGAVGAAGHAMSLFNIQMGDMLTQVDNKPIDEMSEAVWQLTGQNMDMVTAWRNANTVMGDAKNQMKVLEEVIEDQRGAIENLNESIKSEQRHLRNLQDQQRLEQRALRDLQDQQKSEQLTLRNLQDALKEYQWNLTKATELVQKFQAAKLVGAVV